ncbi:polymeric immunoglobulin receptor-like [Megalobrama amblycephala]|uniref:polymeric immunoglobulin receptor-like n=1 Tax=Megalobrama amblycephala TaxID=75352 RepID=UPI002013C609|nr:polymeric immunoglobulin receptor-like [Megalobrama amblycephala]
MRDHLYLFFFMIQFSSGCILSNERQKIEITGYTGGSVVLPCSCAHPQSTVNTFTWRFDGGGRWIPVFEYEKYSGRRVLFNESSPQNLSLLISGLRKENQGYYKCETEGHYITIHLTVKGCNLVQNTKATIAVTGYAGESVVLPCSCSELLAKPEQIRWMYYVENAYKEIYPNENSEKHKNRVKLLNQTSPGNLSLHISALTAEDEGDYVCSVSSKTVYFRLRVEVILRTEKPHIHTSISLSTLQPSHQTQELPSAQQPHDTSQYVFILLGVILSVLLLALLAFIYWRCRGGRNVKTVTRDEEELNIEQDNQDDVTYSTVVHVKTATTPAHRESDPAEHTEYAPIKVKR